MEQQILIKLRERGGVCTAVLPRKLPQELRQALDRNRFCVPAQPPDFPGLLLCDETGRRTWQSRMEDIPDGSLRHFLQVISALAERPEGSGLKLPAKLLRFACIGGYGHLRLLEDGTVLLTPAANSSTNDKI